jgi:hypothetical protein
MPGTTERWPMPFLSAKKYECVSMRLDNLIIASVLILYQLMQSVVPNRMLKLISINKPISTTDGSIIKILTDAIRNQVAISQYTFCHLMWDEFLF